MRMMVSFSPDALHIELEGEFTFADYETFKQMMLAVKGDTTRQMIMLDIKKLTVMDSTGLRLMMMMHDLAKSMHRTLTFVEPQGQILLRLREAALYNALKIAA